MVIRTAVMANFSTCAMWPPVETTTTATPGWVVSTVIGTCHAWSTPPAGTPIDLIEDAGVSASAR